MDSSSCPKCNYPCETCLDSTFCYSCGFDIANKNPPPTCSCKYGMSDSFDPLIGCIVCTEPCLTCSSTSDSDCISCIDDHYLEGTECKDCDPGCNKCTSLTVC